MNTLKNWLHHLFVPHEKNGFKPKLLHQDTLTVVLVVLLIINVSLKFIAQKQWTSILGVSMNVSQDDLIRYTNEERAQHGIPPLVYNKILSDAAADKANDMFTNDYWAHYSPTGTSPWTFFEKEGYKYTFAGENLAKDFSDSRSIVDAWMNSEKHRENILQSQYTEVGFAVREGVLQGKPTILVVQLFGTPEPSYVASRQQETTPQPKTIETTPKAAAKPAVAAVQTKSNTVLRSAQFDAHTLVKRISIIVLGILLIALAIDLYFLERRGFARTGAKSYAHLVIIIVVVVGILIINPGSIL